MASAVPYNYLPVLYPIIQTDSSSGDLDKGLEAEPPVIAPHTEYVESEHLMPVIMPSSSPVHDVPTVTSSQPREHHRPSSPPPILPGPSEDLIRKRDAPLETAEETATKRVKTVVDQFKTHPSLRKPFKSPLLPLKKTIALTPSSQMTASETPSKPPPTSPSASTVTSTPTPNHLRNTASASRAFKSPLLSSNKGGATSRNTSAGVSRSTASLERRLQVLKQAQKIKAEKSDEQLERLVEKWTKVAREAAEDLWNHVRDSGGMSTATPEDSWGYAESKGKSAFSDNWGWGDKEEKRDVEDYPAETPPTSQEEEDQHRGDENQWNMSSMLTSMGIEPNSLGWNEEEGEFVD